MESHKIVYDFMENYSLTSKNATKQCEKCHLFVLLKNNNYINNNNQQQHIFKKKIQKQVQSNLACQM